MGKEQQIFVGGQLKSAHSDRRLDVVNPATEEVIGQITDGDARDVDDAVAAAQAAYEDSSWSAISPGQRAEYLRALADSLEKRGQEIAAGVTAQNGTQIGQSFWGNGMLPPQQYRYFADLAEGLQVEERRTDPDGTDVIVRREPYGVVGAITPWNGPHSLLAWKLGPALAAGNTIVFKAAPETSLELPHFAEAVAEAGIPDGVINYVTGGRESGEALVRHHGVKKIGFTGSTAAGRAIAQIAATQLKPVTLELGGKSAAIMLDDADAATVAEQIRWVSLGMAGQMCWANSRLLVPAHRLEETVDAVVEAMRAVNVGDPLDPDVNYGPLAMKRQFERVGDYVELGRQEGAKLVTGGGRVKSQPKGYYFEPTLFRDVDNRMRIAREEIFGPVLCVIAYDGDDDAVRIANDSEYGLGGTVFTEDPDRGLGIARRVETGSFGVNRYMIPMVAPYGGFKDSGLGRELGPESLDAYLQSKAIYV